MLANVEVIALHLDLRAADGLGNQFIFDRYILFQPRPAHQGLDAFAAESLNQFVFQRDIELSAARIALTTGASP